MAWGFHFPPSETGRMTVPELLRWHGALGRIQKRIAGKV